MRNVRQMTMLSGLFCACALVSASESTGLEGGVVVHVGCGDGSRTQALRTSARVLVQGLDADPDRVAAARRRFADPDVAGTVTAAVWDSQRLPYVDCLVDLLVLSEGVEVNKGEMRRVLAPGGRAVRLPDGRTVMTKARPLAMDEWTHYLHGPDNNAVSRDKAVGPPRCLQWISAPTFGRHHDRLSSVSAMVSAGGRVFSIEDRARALSIDLPAEWRLVARHAFNGVTLWRRTIERWESTKRGFRSGPVQLSRRLVAISGGASGPGEAVVFVALNYGGPLHCLSAATGETLKTYEGTAGVDEILYCDGTLYLAGSAGANATGRRILAVAAGSGKVLWASGEGPARTILPGTLAVGDKALYFHDGRAVVALERSTGKPAWRRPLPSVAKRPSWLRPTIVVHGDVVLCGDRATEYPKSWRKHPALIAGMKAHGGLALLTALSARDGSVLWQDEAAECFHGAVDIFVIGGLVWASRGPARFFFERTRPILEKVIGRDFYIEKVVGRDPHTGEVKKTIDAAEAFTPDHHHRCYRNKATERYLIMGRTGIEFIDLAGGPSLRHNWTRGACQYGVMPANGMLYTPPHPCTCYNASKMNGFFAYSSRKEAAWADEAGSRLQKRRADDASGPAARADDWPTYRHDAARSGCTRAAVGERLKPAWRRSLPGKLSAATSADGKVFIAAVDLHAVHALDLADGKVLWSHRAGGGVDSPPTYWRGRVYFGSADGYVQCLRASDGALAWRFLAAPRRSALVAWDQLESPWPVPGSVLVREGVVYAFAGRSSNLDGGVYLVKLDAGTGKAIATKQIYTRDPKTGRQAEDRIDNLYMPGLLNDVASSQGASLFVREARLSLDGEFLDEPQPHLYSPAGFLDGDWWHRYYMVYGTRFRNGPGRGVGRSGVAPAGRLLVHDGKFVYGYGRDNARRYRLFCTATRPSRPRPGSKGRGRRGASPTVWSSRQFPILVRAMLLAGGGEAKDAPAGRLVVAGPPSSALTDPAALAGRKGGLVAIIDAGTGRKLSETAVDSIPVLDGLCAARGRVVLSLASGAAICLE